MPTPPSRKPRVPLHDQTTAIATAARTPLGDERRWYLLAQISGQILWTTPPNGVTEDSPYWRAYTGQSIEECRGWGWLNAIHPDDRPSAQKAWDEAVATKSPYHVEYRVRRADGVYRDFDVYGAPLYESNGTLREWVGVCTDITERKRAVHDSEKRFRAIFEQAASGIILVDSNGHFARVNQHFCDLVGYTATELATMTVQDITHPADLADDLAYEEQLLAGTIERYAIEKRYIRKDGTMIWISLNTTLMRGDNDEPDYLVGVVQDITDRKQLERRTHEALDALIGLAETLVNSPSAKKTAQQMAELTRHVLDCRRMSIMTIDPATDMIVPLTVAGLAPEQEAQWWEDQVRQPLHVHDLSEDTFVARLRAGEVLIYDMQQPPYDAHPNPYGIRTLLVAPLLIDSTLIGWLAIDHGGIAHEYYPEDQRLAAAVGRLLALVIERERLLHERADSQAQMLALQEANRRMDVFLGIASHELRTPITTAKANAQLMQRYVHKALSLTHDEADYAVLREPLQKLPPMLERSDTAMSRLNRLVNDLLEASRIQAGKLELHLEHCDLSALVQEIVLEQHLTWPERTIEVHTSSEAWVMGDIDRLSQVMLNFLINALKYAPADKPITVSVASNADQVRVAVRDEGPGLSTLQQAHLWERFSQVEGIRQLQGAGNGLGLGLFICRSIIERHAGTVGVESVPNQGSTFWFSVPSADDGAH